MPSCPRFTRYVLPAALAFGPANAAAQTVTEAEFLSALTGEHPALVALGHDLAAAEGERRAPRTENPEIAFEREAPADDATESTLTLRWRPPLGGRRGPANEAAARGLEAAERRLERKRLELRAELRALFARWAIAVETRDLRAELARRTEELAARENARARAGESSALAARRLTLAAAEARSGEATADAELVLLRAEVRALVPELSGDALPALPPLPPPPHATERLTADRRPDVAAHALDVAAAEAKRRRAGRPLSFPALIGGWKRVEGDGVETEGPVVGLEWEIPLFDRGQGDRARAARELAVARAELALAERWASAELDAARAAYESLESAAREVARAIDENARVVEGVTAAFWAGEATLTDLLDTLRSVTESRVASLDLHGRALAAHRRLELSVGRPLLEEDAP